EFVDVTSTNKHGYPVYRRDDGRKITRGSHVLDNRWIVPYNPYLCQKYDCHINVEICSSIRSVKYLYKYVYKGHDRVIVSVRKIQESQELQESQGQQEPQETEEPEHDEITNYLNARYVS